MLVSIWLFSWVDYFLELKPPFSFLEVCQHIRTTGVSLFRMQDVISSFALSMAICWPIILPGVPRSIDLLFRLFISSLDLLFLLGKREAILERRRGASLELLKQIIYQTFCFQPHLSFWLSEII